MKKNIILNLLIVVIVICLALAIYFVLRTGPRMKEWVKEPQETLYQEDTGQAEIGEPEVKEEAVKAPEEEVIEEQPLTKQQIMTYVASHISSLVREIAPEKCPSCGKWQVIRFGFASDKDAYVEYEYNDEAARILINVTGTSLNIKTETIALFEPGANMWNLVKGEDTQFGKKIEFYEQDEQGNWVSIHKH